MDKFAKNILFKTYWQSTGWTDRNYLTTPPEDFEYAKSKGVMFDPIVMSWQELKAGCEKLVSETPLKLVTDAFLSSISKKRIDLRSALASYANIKRLLASNHDYFFGDDDYFLDVDEDDDINVLNFERIKWGGVRHRKALYNFIDLTILQNETVPVPTQQDIDTFNAILKTIRQSAATDTARMLSDNLKTVWPVAKGERDILLEVLGCCGILETLNFDRFVASRSDWVFVVSWRGEDQYNQEKLAHYFGQYGIK